MDCPIVSRKVLLPVQLLKQFSSENLHALHQNLIYTRDHYEKKKEELTQSIFQHIEISDSDIQKKLLNIKRKLFNNKSISEKEYTYLPEILKADAHKLHQLKETLTQLNDSIEKAFVETTHTHLIKEILSDTTFQLSLYLASRSLYKKLPKFLSATKRTKDVRKEEINFLNYIYRALTKPTPFASFTSLGATDFSGKKLHKRTFHYFFNEQIIRLIWDEIKKNYYERIPLQINPTLAIKEEAYTFVSMASGIEEINTIQTNETIEDVFPYVQEKNYSIEDFAKLYKQNAAQVKNFIVHLIDLGLFEFRIPFYMDSETKLSELAELCSTLRIKETSIISQLKELELLKETLCNANVSEHINLIEKAESVGKQIFKTLHIDEEIFNAYGLLFLDTSYAPKNVPITSTEFKKLEHAIVNTYMIDTAYFEKENIRYKYYEFKAKHPDKDIYLVDFYRYYYDSFYKGFKDAQEMGGNDDHIRNPLGLNSIEHIRDEVHTKQTSRLNRSTKDDEGTRYYPITNEEYPTESEKPSVSVALYAQKATINNRTFFVMNSNLSGGYGQWISRFTRIFSNEFTESIHKRNNSYSIEKASISCSNFFNANIHKPILNHGVLYPNSVPSTHAKWSIADITIDDYQGRPVLMVNQTPIDFLHMGFQFINGMPPLYQLMTHFNSSAAKQISMIEAAEQIDEFVSLHPRQVLGDALIIKRKTWETKRSYFQSEDYLELLKFKETYALPNRVFYQFILSEEERSNPVKSDGTPAKKQIHKPKYMDFYNPTSVRCFFQHIKHMPYDIDFTEMLPDIEHMEEEHVTEHIFQINYENKSYSHSKNKPISENEKWLSFFIYVSKDKTNQMLVDTLKPVFQYAKKTSIPLFFVRYTDEKGEHIRLRILKSAHDAFFNETIHTLCGNSFYMGYYEAEYSRYGGIKGKALAIEHFNFTSHFIRELLLNHPSVSAEQLAFHAMQLFFRNLATQTDASVSDLASWYGKGYQDSLSDKDLEQAFIHDETFRAIIAPELSKLETHIDQISTRLKEIVTSYFRREQIFFSYIHMFNNKLGVSIPSEVKLAFALETHLKHLKKEH